MVLPANETSPNDCKSECKHFLIDDCFIHLFEEQVERKPFALALIYKEEKINYCTLNSRANQIAYFLRSKGVTTGTLVPLCLERGVEMVVWILGILKAGGAYVPIDPGSPVDRITYLLADLDSSLLITNKAGKSYLGEKTDIEVVEVEEAESFIVGNPIKNLHISILPDDLAYIIYTSGSTGKPKGVMIEHHSLANYLLYCRSNYISDNDALSGSYMHLSYTFDASLTAMFLPLISGKSVVIASKTSLDTFEDENFWKYAPYDFIKATPAHLALLAETLSETMSEWVTKNLVVGGEALYLNYLKPFIDRGVDLNIVNEYGPTEATVGCSTYFFNIKKDLEKVEQNISIGKPIDHVEIHIINSLGELAAVGEEGEICVSGPGLARGYLKRSQLTEEKFVQRFIHPDRLIRIYRTGDLGKWLRDGNIAYNGRIDNQVKINGYRIETGEIENVLLQNEQISNAVVVAKKDQQGNNKMIAFLMSSDVSLDRQKVFLYLKEKLPSYMIPSEVILLSRFPLTQNGKFDRVSLSEVEEIETSEETEFKAPSNQTQKTIASIWTEILGINKVSVNINFFEIGGSSLQAVKMFSKLREALGVRLSLSVLHYAKTIEQISEIVINKADEQHFSSLVPIQPRGSKPPLFCVHGGWGHVLFYQGLADQLGFDQPLYGLQVRGLSGIDKPFTKLEDMAAFYLKEIKRVQPTGPYQLAGYCYGAIVAFEMADILTCNNEEVALLVNFNGPSPACLIPENDENDNGVIHNNRRKTKSAAASFDDITKNAFLEIKNFARLNTKQKLLYPLKQINRMFWSSKIRISLANAKFRGGCELYIRSKRVMPDGMLKRYIIESMSRALLQYSIKAYEGKMIIFRSPCLYKDPSLGWSNLVKGGITSLDVPGEHGVGNAIFQKPYVQSIASQLEKYLLK